MLRIHGFSLNILSVLFISLTHWVRIKWISAFVYMRKHGICLRHCHIAATEFLWIILWKNVNSLNNPFAPLFHPFLVSTSSNLLSFCVCKFRVPAHSEQTNKIEIHSVLNPFEYVVDNYMYIPYILHRRMWQKKLFCSEVSHLRHQLKFHEIKNQWYSRE